MFEEPAAEREGRSGEGTARGAEKVEGLGLQDTGARQEKEWGSKTQVHHKRSWGARQQSEPILYLHPAPSPRHFSTPDCLTALPPRLPHLLAVPTSMALHSGTKPVVGFWATALPRGA